ncbi:MAG: hypothetical protein CMO80_05110 [Verrucomicrobiales bacterium]|nr:hypothetical protein [Verrucomicrobiales bacterium]
MPVYVYETIPTDASEAPRQFEYKQSMKDDALTHDPDTGLPVRRLIQGGYLSTSGATESSSCCSKSGCGCN